MILYHIWKAVLLNIPVSMERIVKIFKKKKAENKQEKKPKQPHVYQIWGLLPFCNLQREVK